MQHGEGFVCSGKGIQLLNVFEGGTHTRHKRRQRKTNSTKEHTYSDFQALPVVLPLLRKKGGRRHVELQTVTCALHGKGLLLLAPGAVQ